ncbi:hypothetical protein ES703_78121 [subsurface metagenome]
MKRKKVVLIAGFVLVFILTGVLGTYSASGSLNWGPTLRMDGWGGLRIGANTGLGGEVLVNYSYMTETDDKYERVIGFQPSLTYHFGGSSNTSPYLGLGYISFTEKGKDLVTVTYQTSGPIVVLGVEHFFNQNLSCDLRFTLYSENWGYNYEANGSSWKGAEGTYSAVVVTFGVSTFLSRQSKG